MKTPKYEPKQKVDYNGEVCEVLEVSYVNGVWYYKISAKEVDMAAKEVVEGFKIVSESELKPAKEKE